MKRRVWSILTALVLAFGLCSPLAGLMPKAEAVEIADSGKFDPNMTWTLDSEGTLTIHGDGSMYNYGSSTENHQWSVESVAWHKYRDEIRRVVIGEGKGHNWWCVLYPGLCFLDTTNAVVPEEGKQKLKNVLTEEEYSRVTATSDFKIGWFFW